MGIALRLASLTVKPLLDGAGHAVGMTAIGGITQAVSEFLCGHLRDHSNRLNDAIKKSHDRAWQTVELTLAGDSLWDKGQAIFAPAETKALRDQLKAFHALTGDPFANETLRRAARDELRQAKKKGLLATSPQPVEELARAAAGIARFDDPTTALDAERDAMAAVAHELQAAGFPHLAQWLVPAQGPPLLVVASRYFFRRAIEEDPKLYQVLSFARLEQLQAGQEQAFAGLHDALSNYGDRFEKLFDQLQQTVEATYAAVLDIRTEQDRVGRQHEELYAAVIAMQQKLDLVRSTVRPQDSLSIRTDNERRLVKDLIARYRAMPDSQRQNLPALLNAVGQLEVASGLFAEARQDFNEVAAIVADPGAKAEAHRNAYRAALEQRDFDTALYELVEAAKIDGRKYAPFPVGKYQPQRILGAGGFGVAFLCHHRYLNAPVVVKSLLTDELAMDIDAVFTEAQALRQLDHPAIIRLQDCGYADPASRDRPYVVMDYFDGVTLEEYVRENGPLTPDQLRAISEPIAAALQAAHAKGILHRDVKPANILVRPADDGSGWAVKLIDFGLALRSEALRDTTRRSKTVMGTAIAGTVDYAAPEQMGKLGAPVTAASDIYGFGKTCCHALFQTTNPLPKHWKSIPESLASLLERCLAENPKERPVSFEFVGRSLTRLREAPVARRDAPSSRREPVAVARPVAPKTAPDSRRRAEMPPVAKRGGIPKWAWIAGGLGILALICAGGPFLLFRGMFSSMPGAAGGFGGGLGGGKRIILNLNNVRSEAHADELKPKIAALADSPPGNVQFLGLGNTRTVWLTSVGDLQAAAAKIDFGRVTNFDDFFQSIDVDVNVELGNSGDVSIWLLNVPNEAAVAHAERTLALASDLRPPPKITAKGKGTSRLFIVPGIQQLSNIHQKIHVGRVVGSNTAHRTIRVDMAGIKFDTQSPAPPSIPGTATPTPPASDTVVTTVTIDGLPDQVLGHEFITERLKTFVTGPTNFWLKTDGGKTIVGLRGVRDRGDLMRELATWGTVLDQTSQLAVTIAPTSAQTSQSPPPPVTVALSDAEKKQVLADLESNLATSHRRAADLLKSRKPDAVHQPTIAEALHRNLTGTRGVDRNAMLDALVVWGNAESIDRITDLFRSERSAIQRRPIVQTLGKMRNPKAIAAIAEGMIDPFIRREAEAAMALVAAAGEAELVQLLKHSRFEVRVIGAQQLKLFGTRASIPPLRALTSDPEKRVADAAWDAWRTLAFRGEASRSGGSSPSGVVARPKTPPDLVVVFSDLPNDTMAVEFLEAKLAAAATPPLRVFSSRNGTTLSVDLYGVKNRDDVIRQIQGWTAVRTEGNRLESTLIPSPAPVVAVPPPATSIAMPDKEFKLIMKWLVGLDPQKHKEAAFALKQRKVNPDQQKDIRDSLHRIVALKDAGARNEVLQALAVWGDDSTVELLIQLLRAEPDSLGSHNQYIVALGGLRSAKAMPILLEHTQMFFNQGEAEKAIRLIGPDGEAELAKGLSDPKPGVRTKVCGYLKEFGGPKCIPALKTATRDADNGVAQAAWDAWKVVALRKVQTPAE